MPRLLTLIIMSINFGLGMYDGDEEKTSMVELMSMLKNCITMTTSDYFTVVVFCHASDYNKVQEVVGEFTNSPTDTYVWHKEGRFARTGMYVDPNFEMAVVGYWNRSGNKRTLAHFGSSQSPHTDQARSVLNWHAVIKKTQAVKMGGTKFEIINQTEMNVGVPWSIIQNHANASEWVGDFCCGSGSTSVAALLCGCNVIAIDIRQSQVILAFLYCIFYCVVLLCVHIHYGRFMVRFPVCPPSRRPLKMKPSRCRITSTSRRSRTRRRVRYAFNIALLCGNNEVLQYINARYVCTIVRKGPLKKVLPRNSSRAGVNHLQTVLL